MNEKLKEFLDAKKEAEQKKYQEEKQRILIEQGLFEKEYSPNSFYSQEFPLYDHVADKYYKEVPLEITDEEYREIKKYLNISETKKNHIAVALTVIAWLTFVGGFIAGIAFGQVEVGTYYRHTEFSFAIAFVYWSISFVEGTMFLGFAEIIKLLAAIKKK